MTPPTTQGWSRGVGALLHAPRRGAWAVAKTRRAQRFPDPVWTHGFRLGRKGSLKRVFLSILSFPNFLGAFLTSRRTFSAGQEGWAMVASSEPPLPPPRGGGRKNLVERRVAGYASAVGLQLTKTSKNLGRGEGPPRGKALSTTPNPHNHQGSLSIDCGVLRPPAKARVPDLHDGLQTR